MFKFILILCVLLVPVGALFFGTRGCEGVFPQDGVYIETEDVRFIKGQEEARNGHAAEAMQLFQEIIRQHPDSSAESNFELGMLAFNQCNYPLAIYHFNQYLVLRPEASRESLDKAVGLIDSSKKRFVLDMLPGGMAGASSVGNNLALERKVSDVMQQNEALKREIAQLKARLAQAENTSATSSTPMPSAAVPARPVADEPVREEPEVRTPPEPQKPAVPATHTVVPGDTLSAISKKYYGTSARWKDIYNANLVTMKSPSDLKPGMVLKLPRP